MHDHFETIFALAEEEAARINREAGYRELDPDDLAQEAVTVLLEQGLTHDRQGQPIENPEGFIRRVLRNKAMQARAARTENGRSRPVHLDIDPEDENSFGAWLHRNAEDAITPSHENEAIARAEGTIVDEAFAIVQVAISNAIEDPRAESVASAYFLWGREPKDIAGTMGVSHQVVRHLLSKAKKTLRERDLLGDAEALRASLWPDSRTPKGVRPETRLLRSLAL